MLHEILILDCTEKSDTIYQDFFPGYNGTVKCLQIALLKIILLPYFQQAFICYYNEDVHKEMYYTHMNIILKWS